MSTDTATAETQADDFVEDDATIVHDDAPTDEESQDAVIVAKVQKMMDDADKKSAEDAGDDTPPKTEQAGGDDEEASTEEAATDETKSDDLSQALKDRAAQAGLSDDLAQHLHQSGHLEETLATFDRKLIDLANSMAPEESTEEETPPKRTEEKPPRSQDQDVSGGIDALEPLDADEYGEEVAKRDAVMRSQLSQLQQQVAQLSQVADGFVQQKVDQFEDWLDERIAGLNNEDLFGKGPIESLPEDSPQRKNRITLVQGYLGLCQGSRADPYARNSELFARAFPAMFHDDVFKQAQRQTVDRLRDAAGKFLPKGRSSTEGPPKKEREMTEEERDAKLVAKVAAYLDKTGTD